MFVWENILLIELKLFFFPSRITYVIQTRIHNPVMRNPFFFQYSSLYKQQKEALGVLHGFTDSVIQRRREDSLKHGINKNDKFNNEKFEDEAIGGRQKRAFLDSLLHSTIDGKPLDDLEIREEVDTFMFAVSSPMFIVKKIFVKIEMNIEIIQFVCNRDMIQHRLELHSVCITLPGHRKYKKDALRK